MTTAITLIVLFAVSASLQVMPRITDENKGAAVNLATWISLTIMCLVVLIKVFSKLFRIHETINIRNLQSDDYFISVALVSVLTIISTTTDAFIRLQPWEKQLRSPSKCQRA